MSDAPPQLADIPQYSEMTIPTLSSTSTSGGSSNYEAATTNGSAALQNAKATVYNSESFYHAQSAYDTVSSHPLTQNIKDTVNNGPVAENLKDQAAKTGTEFSNLADARTKTPTTTAATGQALTHYHSFFYSLLSWENPRATAISYIAVVAFIFGARYLPALRWAFRGLSYILGATAAAEIAGKLVLSRGLTSSMRPKKYYTIPKESLEASLEDVEQLINFFVIEFQRIVFAENVIVTAAAFVASFISYWLIKFLPLWGLSLIGVSFIYLAPLIYISNKEIIDQQLANASDIVNSQASQVKDLAVHHTARATETAKQYTGDYTSKVQDMIGNVRGRSNSPELKAKLATTLPVKSEPGVGPTSYSSEDFPHAPKQEPVVGVTSHQEQYENSQFGGKAEIAA